MPRNGVGSTPRSRGSSWISARAAAVAADPEAGPTARAFVAYQRALADRGAIDFDDLLALALARLAGDPACSARWRGRCATCWSTRSQDLDRIQLRLALLLAAPANRIFLVGDDDQSIYGWRLADVRRLLALDAALPGLRRVDLEVNYRCPVPVVERAVRLIEHNVERFEKVIRGPARRAAAVILAPDPADDLRQEPAGSSTPGPTTTATEPSSPGRTASCSRRSSPRSTRRHSFRAGGSSCRSSAPLDGSSTRRAAAEPPGPPPRPARVRPARRP